MNLLLLFFAHRKANLASSSTSKHCYTKTADFEGKSVKKVSLFPHIDSFDQVKN